MRRAVRPHWVKAVVWKAESGRVYRVRQHVVDGRVTTLVAELVEAHGPVALGKADSWDAASAICCEREGRWTSIWSEAWIYRSEGLEYQVRHVPGPPGPGESEAWGASVRGPNGGDLGEVSTRDGAMTLCELDENGRRRRVVHG